MTTACPFIPSAPAPREHSQVLFTEHLASALHSLVPSISGGVGLLGRFIWFVPALALAALVWSINKSNRKSELLDSVRFALQALTTVTSPPKIMLMLLVIVAVWVAGNVPPSRLAAVLTLCGVGLVSLAEVIWQAHSGTWGNLAIVVPSAIATTASLVWAARAW